jgi:hypothetical protein
VGGKLDGDGCNAEGKVRGERERRLGYERERDCIPKALRTPTFFTFLSYCGFPFPLLFPVLIGKFRVLQS